MINLIKYFQKYNEKITSHLIFSHEYIFQIFFQQKFIIFFDKNLDYYFLHMEPQKKFAESIETIYNCTHLQITKRVSQLIGDCKNKPQEFDQLLTQLNDQLNPIHHINFQNWSHLIRMLTPKILKFKNNQLSQKFGDYFLKGVNFFISEQLNLNNYKHLQPLLKLSKKITFKKPDLNKVDSKHLALYLQGQYQQNWANELIQLINNEVLVDKKNQTSNALKINPYMSSFIAKNFSLFIPQLERLMVRSENNIDVLAQFFQACGSLENIGQHSLNLMKKYKNLFQTKPELSLRFVKALTHGLNEQNSFYQSFEFIKNLISTEHNVKKKIIYFRMLEGIIEAQRKYKHSAKIVNEIVGVIVVSWAKFIEQTEALFVFELLNSALPLVSQPGPEIAELCKPSLKSQNRYILIFLALTLSYVYKKPEHLDQFGSVKQCFNSLKTQLSGFMKKKQASWHFILPIMNFLSTFELDIIEDLTDIDFLFKKSVLALLPIQQKDALDLIVFKYFKYLEKNAEGERVELDQNLCVTITLLLENNNQRQIWAKYISELSDDFKIQIIEKGLFPLIYLQNQPILPRNKTNKFMSLSRNLIQNLKNKQFYDEPATLEKLFCVLSYANWSIEKFLSEKNMTVAKQISQKYIYLTLISSKVREENEKQYITPQMHEINIKTLISLLNVKAAPGSELICSLLTKLLNKKYYETDREFIRQFEKKQQQVKSSHFQLVDQCKQKLVQMQLHVQAKPPKRKVYINAILQAKMMSEAEVKEQQYREHFEKMIGYFDQITTQILLKNIRSFIKQGANNIWNDNFEGLIHIVAYPQHRLSVYLIVKASFQNFTLTQYPKQHEKQYLGLKKLFLRYSNFFADFYTVRGAHATPSVALMEKSQKFFTQFLELDHSFLQKNHYIIKFINDLSLYVLQNMQFDLSVKEKALNFFNSQIEKGKQIQNVDILYGFIVKNLNIVSSFVNIYYVLLYCLKRVDVKRYGQLFVEILNYVNKTKKLILRSLLKINEQKNENYEPTFEDYIKLKILALDDSTDQEISKSAAKLLSQKSQNITSISTTISNFDMKTFIKSNTKDTIEKLCKFMKESINKDNIDDIFNLVLKTADQLYDDDFDQQGLEFLPYFLSLNLENIPEKFLNKIFEILILKYTANEQFATLSKTSVDTGIDIIKYYAKQSGEKMLSIMESFLSKAKGISNIIFLGVLAPYLKGNKNLNVIEKRITQLFKGDNKVEQCAIAKNMPDLMSFFKNPDDLVAKIFEEISKMDEKTQIGQSYLASGLLKGLGAKKTIGYLEKLTAEDYPSKTKADKISRCLLFRALIQNFGRVVELKGFRIIQILLSYMSDQIEQVRNFSKSVIQIFVTKMSSFSIRQLLPHLLERLENEQNWRIKIAYIWILGIMANCSAKQLQTSLPIIVPTLSGCLSNAHPAIRDKAAEALSLIGETIKNPEISNSIDILIEALENPFQKSSKAIDILLKTRFSHYIDPPSLSIIVPIVDYCLRGRVSELKEGACQVIGSISELILNPSDMLPYLKFVGAGLKTVLCDPLSEIRSIAAMAIGKISSKIGPDNAKKYFPFVYELIDSPNSNTTQKTGAAQAYAEILCSQGYDFFEESLNQVFTKLEQPRKLFPKEGYILVFLYIPGIRKQQFEGFIKEVNQNTYCYVSDEDEALRNSSMQVSKVLISNYGITHTHLLLEPLCDGIFESNWRKRNAALILLGQLLNVLKVYIFNSKDFEKSEYYYQALMAVYIEKDDDLEMPRQTANFVWNTYIENTPKTIRSGLRTLVKMWTKHTSAAEGVVEKNITSFAIKYGQNYFVQMFEYLEHFSTLAEHKAGVFKVLSQVLKRMTQQFLSKPSYKAMIRKFFESHIFKVDDVMRKSLTDCLSLYVQKMHEQEYFQNLIYPQIQKMSGLSQQNPEYTNMLHLLRDLLHNTTSNKVVERLISKVTENPLSEFKIQVITNNTDKIANNLYINFKVPATQPMLEQILSLVNDTNKSNRLALLVYCLNQVSIKLTVKYKNIYINMIIRNLRQYKNKRSEIAKDIYFKLIDKLLEMLTFFLNSIQLDQIDTLEELIGQISPLIFDGTDSMKAHSHRIFMLLISDSKAGKTASYYKQMIVSLDNQHYEAENKNITIWNEDSIIKDYIQILVKGLVYGNNDNIEDNIQMTKFLIKNAEPQLLNPYITKILGPIIRVSSYPLYQRQKEKLLEFIKELYCKGYNGLLEVYNYQIVSVCLRLLNQSILNQKKGNDLTEQITKTLYFVITKQSNNRNRQLLISFIMDKAKGQVLAQVTFKLMDQIIKNDQNCLSSAIYTRVRSKFKQLLQNTQSKTGIKTIYYFCKTIAIIQNIVLKLEQQAKQVLTYEDLILSLQKSYYKKQAVPKLQKVQLLIKQSSREKVYYILKCLHECCLANTRTEQVYTNDYIRGLVPEALSGFEDIVEILEYFD